MYSTNKSNLDFGAVLEKLIPPHSTAVVHRYKDAFECLFAQQRNERDNMELGLGWVQLLDSVESCPLHMLEQRHLFPS